MLWPLDAARPLRIPFNNRYVDNPDRLYLVWGKNGMGRFNLDSYDPFLACDRHYCWDLDGVSGINDKKVDWFRKSQGGLI